jgi:hypothetical protein
MIPNDIRVVDQCRRFDFAFVHIHLDLTEASLYSRESTHAYKELDRIIGETFSSEDIEIDN